MKADRPYRCFFSSAMRASRPEMYFWIKGSSSEGMVWAISSHSSLDMAMAVVDVMVVLRMRDESGFRMMRKSGWSG